MADVSVHHQGPAEHLHSIDWSAALWASIVAGLVFAVLEVAMVPLFKGGSPWAPLHMIGAIGLGPSAMASPDTFDLKVISTAVVIHMVLAVVYGVVLALIIARLNTGTATLIGAAYGLALYFINFYGFTRWFPWFADARDWISIFTHIVQGALWGGLYKVFERRS